MEENKDVNLVSDNSGKMGDEELIRKRKEKVLGYLKKNYNWAAYVVLAVIVYLAVRIRTRNLDGLKDVTTGTWTLGPDLDPFFFLRLSEYIVEHGKIMAVDMMRYVPLGFDTAEEYLLHPYMMAWFHKYFGWTFGTESITHSAVMYPVFLFALTVIAFFFLVRIIFAERLGEKKANVIGLVSAFFLVVMPQLLPRTIAGIPEKESAAFLFFFLAFYFFLASWKAKGMKSRVVFGLLSGAATAGMANIWGGYAFIFLVLAPSVFAAFLLGKMDKKRIYSYGLWVISSFALMYYFSPRYPLDSLFASIITTPAAGVLFVILVHALVYRTNLKVYLEKGKLAKIPPHVKSTILACVIMLLAVLVFLGPSFIVHQAETVKINLIKPASSRLIQTVAENRQPYFDEWASSFGPNFKGLPIVFWLFFAGSIYLFNHMLREFERREKAILTSAYLMFLFSLVFSRYSGSSVLNGENLTSLVVYALGFVIFVGTAGFYYYQHHKNRKTEKLKSIDFGFILLFVLFFMSILSARNAVRTIMVLVPPASIIVSYFAVVLYGDVKKIKDDFWRVAGWIAVCIVIFATVFSGWSYYNMSNEQAASYAPTIYTQQWQKAMAWVRENTPETAVFGHWWDYGYWLQTIGERATVLDGGNAVSYWNHMMGRYALTASDDREGLEFLYAHNTTHFLIDSTDIGKYSAFSLIGSNADYDRASYIGTILKNPQLTQETKNTSIYFYQGGVSLDEDIIFDYNGTRVFLPSGSAGIGGVGIERDSDGKIKTNPIGLFVYQGQQYALPLRYAYDDGLIDFGSGVEAGVFIFPSLSSDGRNIDNSGAMLYLSRRTVKSQVARYYLYGEENENYKLVHVEDDFLVEQIKMQNPSFTNHFIYYQGFRGPIKIWEINYPADIEFDEKYVDRNYPEEIKFA